MGAGPLAKPVENKVTSLEVAARAGVSQSAVSRVFSGASASAETRAKVRAAADALGYRPNVIARSLITGRSKIIGLVVAYLDNPFYPDAIERLSNSLQERGYHIMMFMMRNQDAEEVQRVFEALMSHGVDGIVAASLGMSDVLTKRCADAGVPVVLFNRGQEGQGLGQVVSTNRAGGALAARAFVDAGHQRIGMITGWMGSSTGRDRRDGFVNQLLEMGAALAAERDGLYEREAAANAAQSMVEEHHADAIFVGNDHMAMAAMDMLRGQMGLSVPNDVAIIGFDDVPMAAWPSYDLTTLRQPVNRMVAAVVKQLLARIEDTDSAGQRVEINVELKRRSSTRAVQGEF